MFFILFISFISYYLTNAGNQMRLHHITSSRLLGDGVSADRNHIVSPGGAVSLVRHSQQSRNMHLLYERYYYGFHRRPYTRHRH